MARCQDCMYHEEIDGAHYCVHGCAVDGSMKKVKMYEHIALKDSPCDRFRKGSELDKILFVGE